MGKTEDEKHNEDMKRKEIQSRIGILIGITGISGSGKDSVAEGVLNHDAIKRIGISRIVTHATRGPREGEIPDYHYHFTDEITLRRMKENGDLVEDLVPTGTSYKSTSKIEFERLLNGENLIWRVETGMAADLASGDFFRKNYPPEVADVLAVRTVIILIESDDDPMILEKRKQERDGMGYRTDEYTIREQQEREKLEIHRKVIKHKIKNRQGKLDETIETAAKLVLELCQTITGG